MGLAAVRMATSPVPRHRMLQPSKRTYKRRSRSAADAAKPRWSASRAPRETAWRPTQASQTVGGTRRLRARRGKRIKVANGIATLGTSNSRRVPCRCLVRPRTRLSWRTGRNELRRRPQHGIDGRAVARAVSYTVKRAREDAVRGAAENAWRQKHREPSVPPLACPEKAGSRHRERCFKGSLWVAGMVIAEPSTGAPDLRHLLKDQHRVPAGH